MLFIPFVENSFKHSRIEDVQQGWIHIRLVSDAVKILFIIENSIPESEASKDPMSGIGTEQIRQFPATGKARGTFASGKYPLPGHSRTALPKD